jgi:superfamily II DNA helicase RecQ
LRELRHVSVSKAKSEVENTTPCSLKETLDYFRHGESLDKSSAILMSTESAKKGSAATVQSQSNAGDLARAEGSGPTPGRENAPVIGEAKKKKGEDSIEKVATEGSAKELSMGMTKGVTREVSKEKVLKKKHKKRKKRMRTTVAS